MKKCYDEKDLIKAAQIEYVSELEKLIEKTENCSEVVKSLTKQRDELMEICKLAVFSSTIFQIVFFVAKIWRRRRSEKKLLRTLLLLNH
jgi:hypothetical protein